MYIIGLRERAAVCVRTILAALLLALVPLASHAAEPARAARHMVAAANPHAARAGLDILRAGGSAADVGHRRRRLPALLRRRAARGPCL